MIPYPNKAEWWVIWVTVAVLWLFGLAQEDNPYWLLVAVIVTSLALIWRFSKRKGA